MLIKKNTTISQIKHVCSRPFSLDSELTAFSLYERLMIPGSKQSPEQHQLGQRNYFRPVWPGYTFTKEDTECITAITFFWEATNKWKWGVFVCV